MTFKPDYEGIGRMLVSEGMQAAMRGIAEKVMEVAVASAPFDPHSTDGTHYVERFRVESGVQHRETSRAYGAVINDDPAAFYIEYGTKDTPKHRTLGKALDAARI